MLERSKKCAHSTIPFQAKAVRTSKTSAASTADHETLGGHGPHPPASTNGHKDGASGHRVTLTGGIVRDSAGAAVALEGTFIGILKVLCFSA